MAFNKPEKEKSAPDLVLRAELQKGVKESHRHVGVGWTSDGSGKTVATLKLETLPVTPGWDGTIKVFNKADFEKKEAGTE